MLYLEAFGLCERDVELFGNGVRNVVAPDAHAAAVPHLSTKLDKDVRRGGAQVYDRGAFLVTGIPVVAVAIVQGERDRIDHAHVDLRLFDILYE